MHSSLYSCKIKAMRIRARCPSIFSSIAIELNVPRDDLSSIAIDKLLSPWDTVLKKLVQSFLTFVRLGQGLFKSDYITRYLHNWVVLQL